MQLQDDGKAELCRCPLKKPKNQKDPKNRVWTLV
uniref:Uncharacterized protein n=1 Tax=Rhizophora mucronata TaxID=61149 RepID=A0A2P2NB61_RHIMU